jgi:hypothetical protein
MLATCARCGETKLDAPKRVSGPVSSEQETVRTATLTKGDDGPHNSDGLLLHGWDGDQQVTGFVSRRVMDDWVDPRQPYRGRKSLYREQYNALGKRNLAAIERIVTSKYQRGPAFNRQYPFVDVLLSDITESGEALDAHELVRSVGADVAS